MNVKRIDIEGARGKAEVFRSALDIVVVFIPPVGCPQSWTVDIRDAKGQKDLARKLHRTLDGDWGPDRDAASYLRVLQTFAD